MIRYPRPGPPDGFPTEAIRRAEAELARTGGAAETPEHWKDYKTTFYAAQHGKCAYCEAAVLAEPGAVEHERPKAGVAELRAEGAERAESTNVHGRRTESLPGPGYWWLAYRWDNWCFACNRCNSGWKGCLCPLDLPDGAAYPPRVPDMEVRPLLLSAYGAPDPEEHLQFLATGQVCPRGGSRHGAATIRVCGLHRESLRAQRSIAAERAVNLINCYERHRRRQDEHGMHEALQQLHREGHPRMPFAGVVRSLLREHLDLSWQELADGLDPAARGA